VVEPVERHVDWMTDAVAIRFETDQTRGVGTRFLCDTKVGPVTLTDEMTITEWEPERVMGVRHTGVVTGTGRFTLTRTVGDATVFAWEENLTFPWYLGGPLGAALGGRVVLKRIWRHNLDALRDLVIASGSRARPSPSPPPGNPPL
jgi:hypothetical protein